MKKLLLTTAIATLMSTSAFATSLSTPFFMANGYTKPSISIVEIQAKLDSGVYYNFPAERIAGKTTRGLFKKMLKDGTVLPEIKNVSALKAALDKKQVIVVASADGSVTGALPIFEEIAKQNGVSGSELMSFLVSNQAEGEDFFSNIESVMSDVDSMIAEMQAELNDEISEEVAAEVTAEVAEAVAEEISVEVTEAVMEAVEEVVAEITWESLGFTAEQIATIEASNAGAAFFGQDPLTPLTHDVTVNGNAISAVRK